MYKFHTNNCITIIIPLFRLRPHSFTYTLRTVVHMLLFLLLLYLNIFSCRLNHIQNHKIPSNVIYSRSSLQPWISKFAANLPRANILCYFSSHKYKRVRHKVNGIFSNFYITLGFPKLYLS